MGFVFSRQTGRIHLINSRNVHMATDLWTPLRQDRRLVRVLRLVNHDMTKRPTLTEAASTAGLEKTYFSTYFRREVGCSFMEWSSRVRVEHARRLLTERRGPISHVAAAVGYDDMTTFERNFRKYCGVTPRQYRQQFRKRVADSST